MVRDGRLGTGYGRFAAMAEALGASPAAARRLTDLARETGMAKQQAIAALKSLEEVGWAERAPAGGWRLTPELTRISQRLAAAIADLHRTYLGADGSGT